MTAHIAISRATARRLLQHPWIFNSVKLNKTLSVDDARNEIVLFNRSANAMKRKSSDTNFLEHIEKRMELNFDIGTDDQQFDIVRTSADVN